MQFARLQSAQIKDFMVNICNQTWLCAPSLFGAITVARVCARACVYQELSVIRFACAY